MTRLLLDVASYQGALKPADVQRAGFGAVNLKVSQGLGQNSVHPDIAGWATAARTLGLGVSTFHYLTDAGPGEAQAEYAFSRLALLGLVYGTAHQLDVEASSGITLTMVRAYLERMTELLGRPVALYTGDWWWAGHASWNVTDLSPYLWSAPNSGYLSAYPGDTSSAWRAGYGGWAALSVMQYAVAPLTFPDGSRGTIDVSKSAIRDETVWRDLTTGRPGMTDVPATLAAARTFYMATLKTAGYEIDPLSVGIKGDDSHAHTGTSYHLGKDALISTAYSIVESPRDKAGLTDMASALDLGWFSITVGGKVHNLRTMSAWIVAQCQAGTADTADIREVIYSLDGTVVKRWDRLGKRTTGDSSHRLHTHLSRFRDAQNRTGVTALLTRYFTEIGLLEDDVALTADDKAWISAQLATQAKANWDYKVDVDVTADGVNLQPTGSVLRYGSYEHHEIMDAVSPVAKALALILANVQADDGDKAEVLAALAAIPTATVAALTSGSDEQVAAALRSALGERASAIGALLAESA